MLKIGVMVQVVAQSRAFIGLKDLAAKGEMGWNVDVPIPRLQGIHAEG